MPRQQMEQPRLPAGSQPMPTSKKQAVTAMTRLNQEDENFSVCSPYIPKRTRATMLNTLITCIFTGSSPC